MAADLIRETEYDKWIESLPHGIFDGVGKDFFIPWLESHERKLDEITDLLIDSFNPSNKIITCDIDETILCSLVKVGAPTEWYDTDLLDENIPALPGAINMITELRKKGFEVWLVSNRPKTIYGTTAKNLGKLGIKYDKLILVGDDSKESAVKVKVFATIGDKIADHEMPSEYKFLLNNPFY